MGGYGYHALKHIKRNLRTEERRLEEALRGVRAALDVLIDSNDFSRAARASNKSSKRRQSKIGHWYSRANEEKKAAWRRNVSRGMKRAMARKRVAREIALPTPQVSAELLPILPDSEPIRVPRPWQD